MKNRKCVYTVITGNYERLGAAAVFADAGWDYICLTDNPELRSDTWRMQYFEPPFVSDHARNSRLPKTCPHRYLQDYDVSLYIDNTVTLKTSPEEIEKVLLPTGAYAWGAFRHSFRASLLDEFNRVFRLSLDEPTRIEEQYNTYRKTRPELLSAAPIWAGFLLRRHKVPSVIAAGEKWYAHILRYSRRDQLSLPYVLADDPAQVMLLDRDNHDSEFHSWDNKIVSRNKQRRRSGWKEMLPAGILRYYALTRLWHKLCKKRFKT